MTSMLWRGVGVSLRTCSWLDGGVRLTGCEGDLEESDESQYVEQ